MLFPSDMEDSENVWDFSVLDRAKIEDLEINEKMEAESGSFMVVRQKNGYHLWSAHNKIKGVQTFSTIEKIFTFLENI